jgi:hypothetical protein
MRGSDDLLFVIRIIPEKFWAIPEGFPTGAPPQRSGRRRRRRISAPVGRLLHLFWDIKNPGLPFDLIETTTGIGDLKDLYLDVRVRACRLQKFDLG